MMVCREVLITVSYIIGESQHPTYMVATVRASVPRNPSIVDVSERYGKTRRRTAATRRRPVIVRMSPIDADSSPAAPGLLDHTHRTTPPARRAAD